VDTITIKGSDTSLTFSVSGGLALLSFTSEGKTYIGGPEYFFRAAIKDGEFAGEYPIGQWALIKYQHTENTLTASLRLESAPLEVILDVKAIGHIVRFRGQACWTGGKPAHVLLYYPYMPGAGHFENAGVILPKVNGSVMKLRGMDISCSYLGGMALPAFLIQNEADGLAFLDENGSDRAAEPSSCVRRTYVFGRDIASFTKQPFDHEEHNAGGAQGEQFFAVLHSRRFNEYQREEIEHDMKSGNRYAETAADEVWLGDYADFGPVSVYAYDGTWKTGAAWLREKLSDIPLYRPKREWFARQAFIAEDMGDRLAEKGETALSYHRWTTEKQNSGAMVFHLPGYHEPVKIGSSRNWLNRGDYFFAAENLGGREAVRQGVEAAHRAGGHILYYVEGLIIWKRSRIGRSEARKWALADENGAYYEHYKGFWHPCPACPQWQDWFARTCADIVRDTDIDGFFIDSLNATNNHPCYNPAHNHYHPDVWNWGVRRLLEKTRKAVDAVKDGVVLVCEGAGDMSREFCDGFLAHSHFWNKNTFSVPITRFLHSGINACDSWGYEPDEDAAKAKLIFNAVNGHRIYAHNERFDALTPLLRRIKAMYDIYPELLEWDISELDAGGGLTQLFEGRRGLILTVGNDTGSDRTANLTLPAEAGALYDRAANRIVTVIGRRADITAPAYSATAFEVRR